MSHSQSRCWLTCMYVTSSDSVTDLTRILGKGVSSPFWWGGRSEHSALASRYIYCNTYIYAHPHHAARSRLLQHDHTHTHCCTVTPPRNSFQVTCIHPRVTIETMSSAESQHPAASATPESNDAEERLRRVNELKDRFGNNFVR